MTRRPRAITPAVVLVTVALSAVLWAIYLPAMRWAEKGGAW